MAEYTDPTATSDAATTMSEILAVIAAEEPHGATADHIARTLGLGLDGDVVQAELEELVGRGVVDRRGVGLDAVYTRGTRA